MDLWNEYEGRSIDGLFPLERLIRPEGRSAFFTTTTSGTSTVIRLIESHFDEAEILARWSGVSDLHQPNLLTLTRFGQAMMDETSLVYVVLEPTEADLSQILCDRPLTLAETRQVATSLIPALQALHAKGFIHEHIQPVNVLAVGEVVKLRSDCIREAPEGQEGNELRARDIQDLATLLLQCITQQRSHTISPTGPPLPAPFREIIHNGISGTWTLAQMAAALEATAPQLVKPAAPTPAAAVPESPRLQELHRKPAAASPKPASASPKPPTPEKLPQRTPAAATTTPRPVTEDSTSRIRVPLHRQPSTPQRSLLILAIAVACLMIFAAYTLFHRHAAATSAAAPVAQAAPAATPSAPLTPVVVPAPAPAPVKQASTTPAREQWRVVAFTYNKQDQAAAKAHALEQRYGSLHPAVFTPTGHAPYLVTLGGPLTHDAAFSLRNRLRTSGLPRDLYAQNYSARSR